MLVGRKKAHVTRTPYWGVGRRQQDKRRSPVASHRIVKKTKGRWATPAVGRTTPPTPTWTRASAPATMCEAEDPRRGAPRGRIRRACSCPRYVSSTIRSIQFSSDHVVVSLVRRPRSTCTSCMMAWDRFFKFWRPRDSRAARNTSGGTVLICCDLVAASIYCFSGLLRALEGPLRQKGPGCLLQPYYFLITCLNICLYVVPEIFSMFDQYIIKGCLRQNGWLLICYICSLLHLLHS